jgi:hypothetical protein
MIISTREAQSWFAEFVYFRPTDKRLRCARNGSEEVLAADERICKSIVQTHHESDGVFLLLNLICKFSRRLLAG